MLDCCFHTIFDGCSWLLVCSIVGTFTIFVTDAAISRHVFNHNSADTLLMNLHPSAKNILGARNIAFLHGPVRSTQPRGGAWSEPHAAGGQPEVLHGRVSHASEKGWGGPSPHTMQGSVIGPVAT